MSPENRIEFDASELVGAFTLPQARPDFAYVDDVMCAKASRSKGVAAF
jgi:hypothetical protein